MSYNPPKIDTKYGAPMGRASYIDYIPAPKSCTLQKVNMTSDGAYDTGGAYWGQGAPLYHYGDGNGVWVYVRAWDRDEALKLVQKFFVSECFRNCDLLPNNRPFHSDEIAQAHAYYETTILNSLKRKP